MTIWELRKKTTALQKYMILEKRQQFEKLNQEKKINCKEKVKEVTLRKQCKGLSK